MKNITIKQYENLSDAERLKYVSILDSIKPKECLKLDLNAISWDSVKKVNKRLNKVKAIDEVFELFNIAFDINEEDFFSMPILNFFQTKKFLIEKFVYLQENESKLLQSINHDSGLWELAGGKRLDYFSDNLPLSQLAKIYGGYPFDYGKKPYNEILYLLKMNKEQSEIEHKFQELKSKQK